MYANAINDQNLFYTNPDAARIASLKDVMAPPTLLCDTFRFYGHDNRRNRPSLGTGSSYLPGRLCALETATSSFDPYTPPTLSPLGARSRGSGRSRAAPDRWRSRRWR